MYYLKIENDKIIEAPRITVRNGYQIFGYNHMNNHEMLIEDGYSAYDFPAIQAEILNGEIVKKEIKPVEKTIFTKLEIRRACRALGIEVKLNTLLEADEQFHADWADAAYIDLNDEMFLKAVEVGVFSDAEINQIKEYLK